MGKGKGGCEQPIAHASQVAIPGSRPGEIFYATPGVFDRDAQAAFSFGHCHSLALAVHQKTGWPILGLSRHSREGELTHVVVEMPDGRWLDSRGASEPDGGPAERMDAEELQQLGERPDWLTPDVKLAQEFVDPLLEWVNGRD